LEICWCKERYLGRGSKGNILRKQSWQRERMDWNDMRHRSHEDILLKREELGRGREQRQHQGGKATAGSKADRGNGCKDINSAEKCWRYVDAKRGT
jgi:hypothetical protein